MGVDSQLVVLVFALHIVGLGLATFLLVLFIRSDHNVGGEDEEGDDGGGGGGNERRLPRDSSGPRGGGLPLPDAVPARVRRREPGRLGDLTPARERRPIREPAPRRVPVRRPA